jgi:hypothetical protein
VSPALQISCAKPGCDWVGPPADAATHPCPTVANGDTPTTLDLMGGFEAISAWLLEHGQFDNAGEPTDEETRQATARLEQIVADDEASRATPEPDLDLEPAGDDGTRTWEQRIRDEIQATEKPGSYRWAVIGHPREDGAESVLLSLHAIKGSAEQEIELQSDYPGEVVPYRVSDLVKTAAEHDALEPDAEPENEEAAGDDESASATGPTHAEGGPDPSEDVAGGTDEPTPEPGEQASAIEQLEQAAEAAGGTLTVDHDDIVKPPDAGGELVELPTATKAKQPRKAKAPEAETPADAGALFDATDYETEDLAIPKVDGSSIDRIAIDLSGGVMLDRSNPAHVELYNRVHMRKSLELWVTAVGAGVGAKPATNRDGENDIIVGRKGLRIDAIRVVEPEQLGAVEGLELVRAAARKAARGGATHDQIEAATVAALAELD